MLLLRWWRYGHCISIVAAKTKQRYGCTLLRLFHSLCRLFCLCLFISFRLLRRCGSGGLFLLLQPGRFLGSKFLSGCSLFTSSCGCVCSRLGSSSIGIGCRFGWSIALIDQNFQVSYGYLHRVWCENVWYDFLPPSKKYFEPDSVVTTVPPTALPLIGDVVIGSPSLNLPDPEITPVIEPSRPCFHFDMTGTPRGAELEDELVESVGDLLAPKSNKLMVAPLL